MDASNKGKDVKGRAKEAAGSVTGDKDLKDKGRADQAKAAARDKVDKAKDKVDEVVDKAKDHLT
jgi:uncharacterized protein YjbJ (UPF0337 family)